MSMWFIVCSFLVEVVKEGCASPGKASGEENEQVLETMDFVVRTQAIKFCMAAG